jgi:PAS domain S-box-containing protein
LLKSVAEALRSAKQPLSDEIIEALPVPVYTIDAHGVLTGYNSAALELWGCSPSIGRAKWCGSCKLEHADGKPMRHDECPMAVALQQGRSVRGGEAVAIRPDGGRVPFLAFPTLLYDDAGEIRGAVNMMIDLSAQKQVEASLTKRVQEQQALFRLTETLQHAQCLRSAYDAALDAITAALHCDRAAILLFDADGIMRFIAARGLSEDYRATVEGHSPWRADAAAPEPICVADVSASDLGELQAVILGEGIRSLAFVPLTADGRLVGKFMVYFDQEHHFAPEEMELAATIGRQVGFAVQRMQAEAARNAAEQASRASERRLTFALEAGRMGAWEWNIDTGEVIWSPIIERMHGIEPGSFRGTFEEFKRDIHPDDVDRVLGTIRQAVDGGEDYSTTYRIVRPDGAVRWIEATGKVAGEGRAERLTGVCTDVTERHQNEQRVVMLMREVNHRSKNLLSLVQAVAKYTAASQPEDFVDRFSDRLRGLAAGQDLLIQGGWRGIDLAALVRSQLAHFRDLVGTRITLGGPDVRLSASAAQSIGMALHELATNAGKYGALSNDCGHVAIAWELTPSPPEKPGHLSISWRESGGPVVAAPERKGFGHTVVVSMAKLGLGADVSYNFEPSGVTWRLNSPANLVLDDRVSQEVVSGPTSGT